MRQTWRGKGCTWFYGFRQIAKQLRSILVLPGNAICGPILLRSRFASPESFRGGVGVTHARPLRQALIAESVREAQCLEDRFKMTAGRGQEASSCTMASASRQATFSPRCAEPSLARAFAWLWRSGTVAGCIAGFVGGCVGMPMAGCCGRVAVGSRFGQVRQLGPSQGQGQPKLRHPAGSRDGSKVDVLMQDAQCPQQ